MESRLKMEKFTFKPLTRPVASIAMRTLVAQFGDGYAQRAGDGINLRSENWPLEFFGCEEEIKGIKDFLDRHNGFKSFLWTPPMGVEMQFVTPEGYTLTPVSGCLYSLNVTFIQNNRLV